jgi:predicted amidophosphoribosyltransferase
MAYLAFVLSQRTEIAFYDGLKRSLFPVFGRTQKSRSKSQRIKKDLRLYLKEKESIKDKKILLIDDVTTTGSSIKACAEILLQNGAKRVHALCLGLTPY